jgi:protocatechuate 3,4-dioxygenase alpha subunit
MAPGQTPSQTVGPFFHGALVREGMNDLTRGNPSGERIMIEGRVIDGDGVPVNDALIEIWQANSMGRYDHPDDTQDKPLDPNFHGFGRAATDAQGYFRFRTIKPGSIGIGPERQAPHIELGIFARGLLKRLVTRIYFANEPLNELDPILNQVDRSRRDTLIARPEKIGTETVYRYDVVLQGASETVFFEV